MVIFLALGIIEQIKKLRMTKNFHSFFMFIIYAVCFLYALYSLLIVFHLF